MAMPGAAGDFLVDLAQRLSLRCDPAPIRAVIERACAGQDGARGPDGRRTSTLTISGIPFEVSVSGGRGAVSRAVRYVTETATREELFDSRLSAQLTSIRDLVAWLPNGDETVADMLRSFVATLFPDPAKISHRQRFATWIGVVHAAGTPHHAARLKVYGNLAAAPESLHRLSDVWPGFAGLAALPDHEKVIAPAVIALEVDADGGVNHKVYLRARYPDADAPKRLVRCFGDPAREMLDELVRCGVDAAQLHRRDLFVCCARGAGDPTFGLYLGARRGDDLSGLALALAARHHGTPHAVDALRRAALACGASWHYSAVGLGFSTGHGVDKLNVYGTPHWNVT
ncbi:hypothetical protein [Nocardia niwae]|uniref:hypothetical protein n=1 Tax=Nocardia niwae TaxID=626084 RepID=UPI0033E5FA5B